MSKETKHIFFIVAIALGAYVIYTIFKAIQAGATDLKSIITAPFTYASEAVSAVSNGVTTAATTAAQGTQAAIQLPGLTNTDTQLTNITQGTADSEYAPGGSEYNQIAATQGQAAADAAWAQVQSDYATENQQVDADSSFLGYGNLLSYL